MANKFLAALLAGTILLTGTGTVSAVTSAAEAETEVLVVTSAAEAETEVSVVTSAAEAETEVSVVTSAAEAETEVSVVTSAAEAETELTVQEPANTAETTAFPLSISENGRYFVDANGTPFLYRADTGWFVFNQLSEEEYEIYLDSRLEQGFNTVQIMACWTYWRNNHYGEKPFEKAAKVTTPSEDYWARVDHFVELAAERGMLVNMVPLWLGYSGDEWFKVLNKNTEEECREFGQYLGERYGKYDNVIWTIGGDHDPEDLYPLLDALAQGIKEKAPQQLMTAHTWENQLASDQYGDASWLDFDNVYTYFPQWNYDKQVYTLSEKAYENEPVKPFILIEAGYENGAIENVVEVEDYHVRRQVYWAMLEGACGYAYGNSDIWQFTARWQDALQDEAVLQVQAANELFASLDWWELQPADELILSSEVLEKEGTRAQSGTALAALAEDASFALIYFPPTGAGAAQCQLDADSMDAAEAYWIDPVTGEKTETEVSETGEYLTPGKNSGDDNDWILLLKQAE